MKQRWDFNTSKAIDELETELNLKETVPHWGAMAKLSYTPSNYKHIELYVKHYKTLNNQDKMFVLMEMIIGAIVDQPTENKFLKQWTAVKELLIKDFYIHEFTINYWKDMTEVNFENCKLLSPKLNLLSIEIASKQ